jgi:hypothetical protein
MLLSACGGSDADSKGTDRTKSVGAGGNETLPPSSAGASGPADRPEIAFPDGVENRFESWKTGDPTKDVALSDVAQTVNAVDDGILKGDTNSATVAYYRQGKALVSAQKWIQAWLNADLSWTGVTRYFDPTIKLADKDTASVVYCADESKAYNKDRNTGKVDRSPSDESPYVRYSTQLKRNNNGVWQTTGVTSKRGAKSCAH